MRDEQKNERGIMATLRNAAMKGAEVITGRPVYLRCQSCGQWIERGDQSDCGLHPPIPESADPIFVHFAAAPDPALPEPPKVERLGRPSEKRQVNEKYVDTSKPDPVRESPEQRVEEGRQPYWAEDPDFNPNATAYRRGKSEDLGWGMSSEELIKAQDRAECGLDDDEEPPTPTNPRYTL